MLWKIIKLWFKRLIKEKLPIHYEQFGKNKMSNYILIFFAFL
jgi:hypothetical protein